MEPVLAIDPGTFQSAYVIYDGEKVLDKGIVINSEIRKILLKHESGPVAIEMVASYGMPVGREVFETVVWIGRYVELAKGGHTLVYRSEVKMHLCHMTKAKDANIRQALIDKFSDGRGKDYAIGKKASQGPLYGFKSDMWAALAVAVTYWETKRK